MSEVLSNAPRVGSFPPSGWVTTASYHPHSVVSHQGATRVPRVESQDLLAKLTIMMLAYGSHMTHLGQDISLAIVILSQVSEIAAHSNFKFRLFSRLFVINVIGVDAGACALLL